MLGRLFVAVLMLAFGHTAAVAATKCVTPSGSCTIANAAPGSGCFCATANGLVAGTVHGGSAGPAAAKPRFCCTPAGRFGPNPSASAAVGASCQAKLPNGTVMAGQACY